MLNEAEGAEYCRKRGLHPDQLREWLIVCEQATKGDEARRRMQGEQTDADKRRIEDLEREWGRKDKALVETIFLLTLRE